MTSHPVKVTSVLPTHQIIHTYKQLIWYVWWNSYGHIQWLLHMDFYRLAYKIFNLNLTRDFKSSKFCFPFWISVQYINYFLQCSDMFCFCFYFFLSWHAFFLFICWSRKQIEGTGCVDRFPITKPVFVLCLSMLWRCFYLVQKKPWTQ